MEGRYTTAATLDDVEPRVRMEFERVSQSMALGRFGYLRLDALRELPARPLEGDIGNFVAGVAGAGAGLYHYTGAAWVKL